MLQNAPNGTDRQQLETLRMKIHFRSEKISAILRKTIKGNLQWNRTQQKIPFCSVTFRRLHIVPFRRK
uniref:Uncharacterized protein n=1 Tax=Romanomermis culicivorax TaxID=13658 RepID=A0A915IEI8_ROMCU